MRSSFKSNSIVSGDISLIEAMKRIDLNKGRILFLVDHKGHLQGSLSDGDIRRGLLGQGLDLESPAILAANTSPQVLRAGVVDSRIPDLHAKFSVPVLDDQGRVLDIIYEAGEIAIGGRVLNADAATFFIAEIGNNHNGDMNLA